MRKVSEKYAVNITINQKLLGNCEQKGRVEKLVHTSDPNSILGNLYKWGEGSNTPIYIKGGKLGM